uniref:Uncharacterized protein n=1 Tax=Arundo donax TaxID=35708 RepID=A0A0A9GHX5_ARUDO
MLHLTRCSSLKVSSLTFSLNRYCCQRIPCMISANCSVSCSFMLKSSWALYPIISVPASWNAVA